MFSYEVHCIQFGVFLLPSPAVGLISQTVSCCVLFDTRGSSLPVIVVTVVIGASETSCCFQPLCRSAKFHGAETQCLGHSFFIDNDVFWQGNDL
jgi:hypothetical protein